MFILQAKYHVPNTAIDILVKFMFALFCVLGRFSPFVNIIQKSFPSSLHLMRKHYVQLQSFKKFPVCPKCNAIYHSTEDCIETVGSKRLSKRCTYVAFPDHPHQSRRTSCQALLLKQVQFVSGRKMLYPFKVYCYNGIKSTLQKLLLRPKFHVDCKLWQTKTINHINMLSDVYDGRVWKEFLKVAGSPFLIAPYTYGLMLNVDWFQPYTHTICSVGVVYLTIMNLPRTLRFKLENVIIVGVIPGPSEPSHDINSFLEPLVSELLNFWVGMKLNVCTSSGITEEVVRCALLCISCDLPAGRKVCGFLSYTAKLGCSRCLKEFPGSVGTQNYSGFDRSMWPPRSDKQHREDVKKLLRCKAKTELKQAESQLGCRYSCLLKLLYFSPTRFLVIDPMHNLFLGTGKRMLSIWTSLELLTKAHFEQIQLFVDSMVLPSDVGRIPCKIASGFSGFKADQFKTWITVYSIPSLYQILPHDHMECWRHFVLACRILCKQSLSTADITLADSLLMQFCKRVQRIYGEAVITPNMHLHGHLKDILLDYGPVQEFWCFSFERYNGILGKQPTNNRAIETQLLRQFLFDNFSSSYNFPKEFHQDFASLSLCTTSFERSRVSGSVLDTIGTQEFLLPTRSKRCVFGSDDLIVLKQLYIKLHPQYSDVTVNNIYTKYSSITLKGKTYGSSGKRDQTHPYVAFASWDLSQLYGLPPSTLPDAALHPDSNERPVNVHYYVTATVSWEHDEQSMHHWTLARVSWFFPHPQRYVLGKPAQVWCVNMFESFGIHSYIPIDHLLCRCAHGSKTISDIDETILVVVPLV